MLSSELKKKLSKISKESKPSISSVKRKEVVDFEELFPGKEVETELGSFYICERTLSDFHSEANRVKKEYIEVFDKQLSANFHDELHSLLTFSPEKLLFLDIETTGLSNCPLFLVGTMFLDLSLDNFKLELLFARDYSEEPALLQYLNNVFTKFNVLTTFNGKSFDIPFIQNRMVYYRMPRIEIELFHFDVLSHSRRKWRGITPNCKLQTLETYICGRRRMGDIPSELIPEVYHEFVRTGNTKLLKEVFHHNALDLITMAELIAAMFDEQ